MLTICLSEYELYNELTNKFLTYPALTVQLEHSLVSLYKWESKWKIPFLHHKEFTQEQYYDYIKCMILNPPNEPTFMTGLTPENIKCIQDYISHPMTASIITIYPTTGSSTKKEIITAEVIYSQMIANNIPFECQYWHLNQLTTLIKICNVRNNPDKMSKADSAQKNALVNAQRRAKYNTKG